MTVSTPASWPNGYACNDLKPVYHGETGVRMLRELARSYLTIVKDLTSGHESVESAVSQLGDSLCRTRRLLHPPSQRVAGQNQGGRRPPRAEQLYQQLDMLQHLRQQARRELLAESRKHAITAKLRQIPSLGPIRSALAVALIQTPHRFRTKRQLWAYSGLALETRTSGEYCYVKGQLRRSKKTDLHSRSEQGPQSRSERLCSKVPPPGPVSSPDRSRISTSDRWPKASSPPWCVSRWRARLQPLR